MNTTRDYAKLNNIQQLQWQTPDWNEAVIRFYNRVGATGCAKQRFV